MAPQGAMDQMGHVLDRIIYAYAEVDKENIIFAGKDDAEDNSWRCAQRKGKSGILPMCSHKKKVNTLRSSSQRRCKWGGLNLRTTVVQCEKLATMWLRNI